MATSFTWDEFKLWFSFPWVFALTAVTIFLSSYLRNDQGVEAPFVGRRHAWEPPILSRLRFSLGAKPIIMEGYTKERSLI